MSAGAQRGGDEGGIFASIGVRRVVNGVGPATRLGGVALHPSVVAAMTDATHYPVRMDELERSAGRELARMLGVESAYVTSGASAALTLATAAIIAGEDAAKIDALPRVEGVPRDIVVLAAHRDPYDRALEAAGARLRVVGYPATTHLGEVDRALDDETAGVLYRPGRPGDHPPLSAICELAARRGIPVLIDGALYAPPLENLHRWMDAGAALVALSGGKHFRGPQASGILCGHAGLVDLVALQHQDMDEREATWIRGARSTTPLTPPRQGIGRAMKVGREQIAGLIAAVTRYVEAPGADDEPGIRELQQLRALLQPGTIPVIWHETSVLGVPVLELDLAAAGLDADSFVTALRERDQPIFLEESEAWRGVLQVNPMGLTHGDGRTIAEAVTAAARALRGTEGEHQ